MKPDFKPGVGGSLLQWFDFRRRRTSAIVESHATSQPLQRSLRGHTLDFNFVDLLDAIARGGDEVCEVSVVGQKQEAFSIEIQTRT